MKTYEIGQIFIGTYTPDVAIWCNSNNAFIEEIEPKSGKKRYQIKAIPKPDIETVKAEKIASLKNERQEREAAPVPYMDKLWDFDAKSRDRITAAITALEVSDIETITWTAYDDTSSDLTIVDLKNIIATAAVRGNELHTQYRVLRDAVNAAETVEEIENINWE